MVLGYAYASRYRDRSAYDHTAEVSLYIHPTARRLGLGSALLGALIPACREAGLVTLLAVIAGDEANKGSVAVHSRAGFERCGLLRGVGKKFGVWIDVVLMQLDIAERAA